MTHSVIISKSVQKQVQRLPQPTQKRVQDKLVALKTEPRPSGALKLKGYENQYRLRIGDYRIRYEVDDETLVIKILQCKHRRDVYKDRS